MDDPVRPATGGSFVMSKSGALQQVEGPGLGYPEKVDVPPESRGDSLPILGGSYVASEGGTVEALEGPAWEAAVAAAAPLPDEPDFVEVVERFDTVADAPDDDPERAMMAKILTPAPSVADLPGIDPQSEERKP